MKLRLIIFSLLAMFLGACKKDNERVFDESPDARLNKALAAYQTQLTGAANGWRGVISLAGGSVYSFYCKFSDSNRVKMVLDFDSASAVTLKESSYRLKALQQPSLIFDTYTYLHVLADPTGRVNGGADGEGLRSDFEFYFSDSSTVDTVKLVGRMNGSTAYLVKATAAEATAYTTGQFDISKFISAYGKILEYFKQLTIGAQTYELLINPATKTIVFNWLDASGNVQSFSTRFYFTLSGIGLLAPFNTGTMVIKELTNVNYVTATSTLEASINGTVYKITGAIKPLKVDLDAPKRWWNWAISSIFAVSDFGFHINGVDDAQKIRSLAGFQYLEYRPLANSGYDACRIIASAAYGPAIKPNFTVDGKVIFPNSGLQFGTVPTAATTTYIAFLTQLFQAQGYYLVQTSGGSDETTSYDMVNVLNARAWISWHY